MDPPIIDLHCHPTVPAVVAALGRNEFDAMTLPILSAEEQMAMMVRHGIEASVFPANGVAGALAGSGGSGRGRAINEAFAALVAPAANALRRLCDPPGE